MLRVLRVVLFVLTSLILVALAASNSVLVSLALPFSDTRIQLPIYLVIVFAVMLGIILASIVYGMSLYQHHRAARLTRRRIEALEQELEALRVKV